MVFVPSSATGQDDFNSRIIAAVNLLDEDILRDVWDEFNYRLDVICAAGGRYMRHL